MNKGTSLSTAAKLNVAGLIAAAGGIMTQYFGGSKDFRQFRRARSF